MKRRSHSFVVGATSLGGLWAVRVGWHLAETRICTPNHSACLIPILQLL